MSMASRNFTLTAYQTLDPLYSGTRTLVYRAFRTNDKQLLAIKVLQSKHPSFSELVQFRNQYTIRQKPQLARYRRNLQFGTLPKHLCAGNGRLWGNSSE